MIESPLMMKMQALSASLSQTERKVLSYILEHPREVIYLSITGLAERSGVSDATIVRLCKRIGMQGYQDLKVNLAQDIVSPLESIHE
jgi:DNA-binding MurR/RpiR family transcriptional regulator